MSRRPAASTPAVTPRVLPTADQVIDELHQQQPPPTRPRSARSSSPSTGPCCTPAPKTPLPPPGAKASCSTSRSPRSPGQGHRWSRSSPPPTSPPRSGVSFNAGRQLLADALELTYRLPALWSLVRSGKVPVWLGRSIARETHDLSEVAVAHADRLVCAVPSKIGQVRARRLIDEARLYHDPDRAQEDERQALAERHVTLSRSKCPATQGLHLMLDRADAQRFDHTIAQIAAKLSALGDDDGLDVRRARAVGILADPQHTLDLLARPVADRSDPFTPAREAVTGIGPKSYSGAVDGTGPTGGGSAVVYLHLTPDDLAEHLEAGTGTAVVERIGATSLELVETWLAGTTFTVRPVLDLTGFSGPAPALRCHSRRPAPARGRVPAPASHPPGRWHHATATTPAPRCEKSCSCATRRVSSPAAGTTPAAATSTTSTPSSHPMKAGRPGRRTWPTSRPCAGCTTGSRPSPGGTTDATPTGGTSGPALPGTPTPSNLHRGTSLPEPGPGFDDGRQSALLNHRAPGPGFDDGRQSALLNRRERAPALPA